jgi:predicted nucleotide-binding protein
MNQLEQLRLHVLALSTAVEQDSKFFASIIHYVQRFKEIVTNPPANLSQEELQLLARKIEEFYRQWRPTGEIFYVPPRQTADTDSTVHEINQLVSELAKMQEAAFKSLLPTSHSANQTKSASRPSSPETPCVFIGHGRNKLWARLKVFLQDELGLATVTYESEPRSGESIVPILEKMLNQATFSVVVLTAEDETADGSRRARQNVVHEAGLFQGRLGFQKAILLVQEGLEEFSNVSGLQYIPFSDDRIEQSFYELQRVLKREKQIP